jgi:hypothetical protein
MSPLIDAHQVPRSSAGHPLADDPPLEGYGPDDVHVEFRSPAAWKILRPLELLQHCPEYTLYGATTDLVNAGQYELFGSLQYSNYDWWPTNASQVRTSVSGFLNQTIEDVFPPTVHVQGSLLHSARGRPCYRDALADGAEGTWVRQEVVQEVYSALDLQKTDVPVVDLDGWRFLREPAAPGPLPLRSVQRTTAHYRSPPFLTRTRA